MENSNYNKYQANYKKQHYTQLSAWIDAELASKFKKKLEEDSVSFAQFMRNCINIYLDNKEIIEKNDHNRD